MRRKLLVLPFLCLFFIGKTFGSNEETENSKAVTLYNNRQYDEALTIWSNMANPKNNAGVYFNIGLAESQLHHTPEAIYAYEQALRLRPLHLKFTKALEQERKKMDNPIIPLGSFFMERWYMGWITFIRPGTWAALGLLIIILALVTYLFQIGAFVRKKEIPKKVSIILVLIGAGFLITAFLSHHHLYQQDEGILMQTCELKQASSEESPVLRQLSAGEKVRIKDKIGEWNYVALLNLDYGWVKSDCIKIISIEAVDR